jgi:hypothetical protein
VAKTQSAGMFWQTSIFFQKTEERNTQNVFKFILSKLSPKSCTVKIMDPCSSFGNTWHPDAKINFDHFVKGKIKF